VLHHLKQDLTQVYWSEQVGARQAIEQVLDTTASLEMLELTKLMMSLCCST
jgi:hypothetical protein